MARIRTVKPEFFRHELLQELQSKYPQLNPMLVFAGLWTIADKNGVFIWKPKVIHLDILPFIEFDMGESLELLKKNSFIRSYIVQDKEYGQIINFNEHQRITGKEFTSEPRFPIPPRKRGNTREAHGKHPDAQERERERERIIYTWNSQEIRKLADGDSKVREKTLNKIDVVLEDYPLETIIKAIENYGTVIKGEMYFFKYRWELIEFLQRGLRKFIDEAKPLENFLSKKQNSPTDQPRPHMTDEEYTKFIRNGK